MRGASYYYVAVQFYFFIECSFSLFLCLVIDDIKENKENNSSKKDKI